ncbi:hypothetical protein RRG08_027290 [Elysia crispata]|uniref:Uncharacterized protein n=1 Tax=Elysia crispata TaxID=231223 RepID=A0AAE1AZJ2_9GAST|nr:hypothetical protein RRG08_027290 [Elysia crispata]
MSGGSEQTHRSVMSAAVANAWRHRTVPYICQERSSGPSLAALTRTETISIAEQWPRPRGSEQNRKSIRSGAMANAWRKRTEPQASQERSSGLGLTVTDRTRRHSGAKRWPRPGGSEHYWHRLV